MCAARQACRTRCACAWNTSLARGMTKDGEIVLTAGNFRTQEANRRDAIGRLVRMIRQAAIERAVRKPTRPTLGAKQRRLTGKTKRGEVKRQRRPPGVAGD